MICNHSIIGSAIGLGASVFPLFQQLGIYEEFLKHGKHVNEYHMFKEDLNLIHTMQTTWLKDA